MRVVTDAERRARIGVRHALAGASRVRNAQEATRAVVCLHATDPPSVHLSCWARVDDLAVDDVEQALYATRSLVRQSSMRETLFVFPRDLVPAVWGSAAARVAIAHRKRLVRDLERWGPVDEGRGHEWLQRAEAAVLDYLADGVARSSAHIREQVTQVSGVIEQAPGTSWGGRVAIAPKVLAQLALDAVVCRASNIGPWYTSRPTWTTTEHWWNGEVPDVAESRPGYAELVGRWLWSYGPGTVEDIAWWLGATKAIVRTALADLAAQQVLLEDGSVAWLRADDVDPVGAPEPWVALLPLLDPTVMGWRERGFAIGSYGPELFDSVGNAGTTAWVDGRVVGAWVQDSAGRVQVRALEDVGPDAHRALSAEAVRLTGWLDGQRVFTVYPSPIMQPGDPRW